MASRASITGGLAGESQTGLSALSVARFAVLTIWRRKRGSYLRAPLPAPTRVNEQWNMEFVTDRLLEGRRFEGLQVH